MANTSADVAARVEKLAKAYKSIDEPEFIKSGSVAIDALLGGGVPRGCFILWSSGSGIGKSTGALHISRSYCVQGKKVLYLDYEGGVNKNQLSGIGLLPYLYNAKTNPSGLFMCFRVHSYVDAETFLDNLLGQVDLVIFDSVTAILPAKMKEKSVEDIQPGLQSRLMANLLLKYKAASMQNQTTWIMINQMRTHIRFIGMTTDEEAGGNALKFYSDYRILMKEKPKSGKLEKTEKTPTGDKKVPYGSVNDIWCIKSRYSRPFIPLNVAVVFGKGISNNYAYKDYLEYMGCIKKDASYYSINVNGKTARVQGENKVIDWIHENRDHVIDYVNSTGGYRLLMDEKEAIATDPDEAMLGGDISYEDDPELEENIATGNLDEEAGIDEEED